MFPKYVLLSICAFIRVYFGRPGKFHSIHPSGVHIFFQKLVMISEFFQRKVGSHLFSKACWFFSLTTYFSFSIFFLSLSFVYFFFLFVFFFPFFFFMRYFATYTCVYFCEVFLLYTCISKVSLYLNIQIYIL